MSKKEDKRAEYHTRKDIPGVKNRTRLQTEPCYICGSKTRLHRHRVIPGGTYEWWNVVIVCNSHHRKIHDVINKRIANQENLKTLEQYQHCIEIVQTNYLNKLIIVEVEPKPIEVTKCPLGIPRSIDLGV